MSPFSTSALLAAGLFMGLVALLWEGRRHGRRPRAFVEVHPRYRLFLRRQGLTEARHFLDLSAAVVSGHPGRSVARVALADDDETIYAFLKRESRVSWLVRLAGAAAGFGFVSRSLREARTLEALEREGVGCPEWLAAGEDENGRAFLLVRETPGAMELRAWLRQEADPVERRRLARSLGAALAHLHTAGFSHPDLYSKHVLIAADPEGVQFLDWQRSRRRIVLDARRRARDLAALHATLADDLAPARERLVCLGAYCAGFAATDFAKPSRRSFRRLVLHYTRRLLRRRHIREKRQPPLGRGVQEWITLNGGELCVTPALAAVWPGRAPQWLALDRQAAPDQKLTRRWLATDGAPALLMRRCRPVTLADLPLWGEPPASVEQRHAELLLRLQRHAVPAPLVLAMGRRAERGRVESFVLTQPAAAAVRLTAWLERQTHRPETLARRRRVLREAGALLHRLHDATCYLDDADALAVQASPGEKPLVLLMSVEPVKALRRPHSGRARRDLAAIEGALTAASCSRSDCLRFLTGYRRSARESEWRKPSAISTESGRLKAPVRRILSAPPADSLWSRLVTGCRRLRQRADWTAFVGSDWPDCIMDVLVTDRFHAKQGRSTGRWILYADGRETRRLSVYLKRHYHLPWSDRWLTALWPSGGRSPAFREWDHLEWARRVGVPVPKTVAAAEYVGPWGRLRSFLAVEELHDMLPVQEVVPLAAASLTPAEFRRWKRGLIAEMARLTRLLHDRCRFHKDLYLCHFYIARADAAVAEPAWRGRVFLIDLHRLGRHPWTWLWWRMKDLAQLLYSTEVGGIDPRDRLYFWQMYRGPGPRRRADRWLVRLVLFKWRRYRRHNARKKAREVR
jgi:tRNA A-37 threonylcarbamoyl transferase component Bud32